MRSNIGYREPMFLDARISEWGATLVIENQCVNEKQIGSQNISCILTISLFLWLFSSISLSLSLSQKKKITTNRNSRVEKSRDISPLWWRGMQARSHPTSATGLKFAMAHWVWAECSLTWTLFWTSMWKLIGITMEESYRPYVEVGPTATHSARVTDS